MGSNHVEKVVHTQLLKVQTEESTIQSCYDSMQRTVPNFVRHGP